MTVAENARTVGDWNHDGDRDCAYTFCTHAIYLSLSLLLYMGRFFYTSCRAASWQHINSRRLFEDILYFANHLLSSLNFCCFSIPNRILNNIRFRSQKKKIVYKRYPIKIPYGTENFNSDYWLNFMQEQQILNIWTATTYTIPANFD